MIAVNRAIIPQNSHTQWQCVLLRLKFRIYVSSNCLNIIIQWELGKLCVNLQQTVDLKQLLSHAVPCTKPLSLPRYKFVIYMSYKQSF